MEWTPNRVFLGILVMVLVGDLFWGSMWGVLFGDLCWGFLVGLFVWDLGWGSWISGDTDAIGAIFENATVGLVSPLLGASWGYL
jgi:hypothetical protein